MIKELIEKHTIAALSRALDVNTATIHYWRHCGCLPYYKGGAKVKQYEKRLAKLEGMTVGEFRKEAYAEYLAVQAGKSV